jgi:hypothetical protein
MANFDERKDTFEKKFAHDEALKFKAGARRNKLLGQWAAGLMGLSGEKADEYARSVIKADFEEDGDEDVFLKVKADLDAAGIGQTDHQIRRHMDEFMAEAINQIRDQG